MLALAASDTPLPLQDDSLPSMQGAHLRWGRYNEPFEKPKAPKGAVPLAALVKKR